MTYTTTQIKAWFEEMKEKFPNSNLKNSLQTVENFMFGEYWNDKNLETFVEKDNKKEGRNVMNDIPKVIIPYKLCSDLMDCLAALAFNVTGDIKLSEIYAKSEFQSIMNAWEETNNFEFEITEED
jgi:hypothetical protein